VTTWRLSYNLAASKSLLGPKRGTVTEHETENLPTQATDSPSPNNALIQHDLGPLMDITRATASGHDAAHLLQTIVQTALTTVPSAEKGVIHLLHQDGRLEPRYCSRPWPSEQQPSGIPRGIGVAGRSLAENAVIYVADTARSLDYARLSSHQDVRSLVVAPLCFGERQMGTLSLSSAAPDAFAPSDVNIVTILAAQAAIALGQTMLLERARAERRKSDAIIDQMSEGLLILSPEDQVRRANRALGSLITGQPNAEIPPLSTIQRWVNEQLLDSHAKIMGGYCVASTIDCGPITFLSVTPSTGAEGGERVFVVHDVTSDRESTERRALFVSQISHELRTPLQHILSSVGLITEIDDLSTEERRRYLKHIEDETYHMNKLVDDLVALSRIEVGHFEVSCQPLRVDLLVSRVLGRMEPRARVKNLALAQDDDMPAVWAFSDPLRLEQVLLNILSNACKYTPARSIVHISLREDGDWVHLAVRDAGPGIPADQLRSIFDPFVRLPQNSHVPGMGLGLYISQQIMQMLGGRIDVSSSPQGGSTFGIVIPRTAEHAPDYPQE